MTVIHKSRDSDLAGNALVNNQVQDEVKNLKIKNVQSDSALLNSVTAETQASGIGTAILVIVCVGLLVFLVVVTVMRIRTVQQRAAVDANTEDKEDLEWDNSALTITVNPMEREINETEYVDTDQTGHCRGYETDTDDDIGSFHDDGPDTSDEEEGEGDKERKVESMEWDSTTAIYAQD